MKEEKDMYIQTRGLTKRYGDLTAVDQLDLEIPKGSLVAYLGTNGAGEFTTIRMLTRLLMPTEGAIKKADRW